MDEEIIAHMKERMRQVRRIVELAHGPEMIAILNKVIESGEADIARFEAERQQGLTDKSAVGTGS